VMMRDMPIGIHMFTWDEMHMIHMMTNDKDAFVHLGRVDL